MNRMNVKDSKATDRKYNLIYKCMVHITLHEGDKYVHENIYDVSKYIISIYLGLKKNQE